MSKWLVAGVFIAQAAINTVAAQPVAPTPAGTVLEAKTVNDWLMRMHEASKRRAYVGTFVVSSPAGMSSSKIWHVCDGTQQLERVETLSGEPRATFRHNDLVRTFLPSSKTVISEKRESLGMFPNLLASGENQIAEFYGVKTQGKERVAGVEADVLQFEPKDKLRFGYRLWAEAQNGLVVKMQTLDSQGAVLEQAAFSELQLNAPVKIENLSRMMNATEGYTMQQPDMVKTTAAAEGWALKAPLPGFKSMGCFKRPMSSKPQDGAMQWIFSDGMASVSLFIERDYPFFFLFQFVMAMGATHTLVQRLGNSHRVTVMGEVPPETLQLFAQRLERKK